MRPVDEGSDRLPFAEDAGSVQRAILEMGAEAELQLEVVQVFFEELGIWQRQLQDALAAAGNPPAGPAKDRLISCLHEVAGGLHMAGAARAASHIRRIEFTLREEEGEDLAQAVHQAIASLQAGAAALRSWMTSARAEQGGGAKHIPAP